MYKVKQSRNRPGVAQRIPGGLGSQISNDIRHMKVVRSSVSHTGHLYSQEIFLILIFTKGCVKPQGYGTVGRKYVTEKSSDTTGNRSRDSPTSSDSALTTTLPQAPLAANISLNTI